MAYLEHSEELDELISEIPTEGISLHVKRILSEQYEKDFILTNLDKAFIIALQARNLEDLTLISDRLDAVVDRLLE